MYGRAGLDRFKKAQTLEPFLVTSNSSPKTATRTSVSSFRSQSILEQTLFKTHYCVPTEAVASVAPVPQVTQVGGGQSTWQPPDWAIEALLGVYVLEVLKDGEVLGCINLNKRRHLFGRQFPMCDYVLDHQSISRQHAAVVTHKNGSIFVIDLGSVHGTFVAYQRLTKDIPVELEVGQSLRFAASTRSYILRKNVKGSFCPPPLPMLINLPTPPDPSDEEACLAYNKNLNRYGLGKLELARRSTQDSKSSSDQSDDSQQTERAAKRVRKERVDIRDQTGGEWSGKVGISDSVNNENEHGPVGMKKQSLVGKYESLVEITVVPKGREHFEHVSSSESHISQKGITDKLQEVINKVKSTPKGNGIYDDLYGESFSGKVGSSWAYATAGCGVGRDPPTKVNEREPVQDSTKD